jgi:hypothetical protein
MLHEETPILHDVDALGRQPVGDGIVAYTELQPHGVRVLGQDVIQMPRHVIGAPEHVDQIDVARDVRQAAVDRLAEDGRDLGVVDGHGDDVESRTGEIRGHGERGLVPLRLGLDPEHGDTLRAGQKVVDVRIGLESAAGHRELADATTVGWPADGPSAYVDLCAASAARSPQSPLSRRGSSGRGSVADMATAFPAFEEFDGLGLAELVKKKEVAPAELVEAALQRIEAGNGRINAVVHRMYDSARERAKQPSSGPFAGVPMLLKGQTPQGFHP